MTPSTGWFPTVGALNLAYPVLVVPPMKQVVTLEARSDAQNRLQRVNVVLNAVTGVLMRRDGFGLRKWVDQTVGVGVVGQTVF